MASDKVKTFTDSNFDDSIKQGVVLVDLWAEWCQPCRRLSPAIDALASEYDGRATVAKLNIDENPTTPSKYRVLGIPTVLVFKDGSLVDTLVGPRDKAHIASALDRHVAVGASSEKSA
jgi:thioredoxin 1